ncbi:Aste57867_22097 [Aphanomyces stellatus]|uniref:Aste57867_22097 protein n=1 Tax=Aphanomyces stellatus TaxID=120398 RepID=A0A485LJZ1_9STRA|nr:hypothetical protein As57867_022028 [Aphanomyces stellatus]VFT98765.1 Aste57867_22097 [Aphanomyces stellatus]
MSSAPLELISLSVSPYSLTARWALNYCGVPFKVTPYEPILGELGLRLRLLWRGYVAWKVTVPVLLTDKSVLPSTFDIALYAHEASPDRHFLDDVDAVRMWDTRYQRMLSRFRHLLMTDVQAHPDLAIEYAPPALRQHAPSVASVFASVGVSVFNWKYSAESAATNADVVRDTLVLMQKTLATQPFLLGDHFTYADMLMAVAIDLLVPGPQSTVQGKRKDLMLARGLADGFDDVVAWKTSIFDRYFTETPSKSTARHSANVGSIGIPHE